MRLYEFLISTSAFSLNVTKLISRLCLGLCSLNLCTLSLFFSNGSRIFFLAWLLSIDCAQLVFLPIVNHFVILFSFLLYFKEVEQIMTMQSVKLSQLSSMQKAAVMDYIAAHRDFSSQEPVVHFSTCSVDITFPEDFFSMLREKELAMVSRTKDDRKQREKEAAQRLPPSHPVAEPARPNRSLSWLLRLIDDVYGYRSKQFVLEASTKAFRGPSPSTVDDLAVHVFAFLSKRFGVPEMVRRTSLELLESVKFHRELDHDTQLFSVLLSSSAYDTADVKNFLEWRSVLMPYAHVKGDAVHANHPHLGQVQRKYVRVSEIPSLVRKCVAASKMSAGFFNRCRDAYPKWCDEEIRFPAVVPDPNFYCPPFHPRSPYVGSNCHSAFLTVNEAKFYPLAETSVVPMSQILLLLLQNAKAERAQFKAAKDQQATANSSFGHAAGVQNSSFHAPSRKSAEEVPSTPREIADDSFALERRFSRLTSF